MAEQSQRRNGCAENLLYLVIQGEMTDILYNQETSANLAATIRQDRMDMTRRAKPLRCIASAILALTAALPAQAEMRPTLSFAGVPGIIDMPSAAVLPDATFSVTSAHFGPVSRNTLAFQISPRLSGTFRYAAVRNWDDVLSSPFSTYFDRSFDLRYQIAFEGKYRPAIAVGLVDMIGTGQWAGEYLAFSKTFKDKVRVTAGLGWGRLASHGAIGGFGTRAAFDFGNGGTLRTGQWFKGDIAPFMGVEWQVNDRWGIKAEYSSDAYVEEAGNRKTFDRKSPFNFGVEYQATNNLRLGAHYLYGSQIGLTAQFVINPKNSPTGGPVGNPPPLLRDRAPGAAGWSGEWVRDTAQTSAVQSNLVTALKTQGVTVESVTLNADRVEVRVRLPKGGNGAQAIGRTARILTAVLPASVERFEIVPVANGMPLSKVVLSRGDLEQLDHSAGQDALLRERTQILAATAAGPGAVANADLYPKLDWKLRPYVRTSFFDPDNPIRGDLGIRLSARYEIAPNWVLAGAVSKRLVGNLADSTRVSTSVLPHVRSDGMQYDINGDLTLDNLTLAWTAKPAANLYSRVTVGYLERMYGGVSAELLWKPVASRLAIGAELNYVRQRDFDQHLGFRNYDMVTGHVSGYYTFDNGISAQLDVGRYLAGDYGATLTVDREFANGWRVGAFATLTDVSFDDFGEGSFDKGIRIQIPVAWMLGRQTERTFRATLRPVQRDGGARLDVDGRLYETVRSYDSIRLDDQWGSFWR